MNWDKKLLSIRDNLRPSEFNARWLTPVPGQDFDPPACDTGLVLLRRWAVHDPALAASLPSIPDDATGPLNLDI